jgi:hypothetical protein
VDVRKIVRKIKQRKEIEMDGWIRCENFSDRRVKNFCIDMRELETAFPGKTKDWKGGNDFPLEVASALKEKRLVPEDAALVAWFFEAQRLVFVIRFWHLSFTETNPWEYVLNENVSLLQ